MSDLVFYYKKVIHDNEINPMFNTCVINAKLPPNEILQKALKFITS
jgi:hypothetical protein